MISRRVFISGMAIASSFLLATAAGAVERTAFTAKAFEAAQKAGRSSLVEISAPWCPTCKAQKKILGELFSAPPLSEMIVFEVDFDTQKDVVRSFGATMQSTLITFKGVDEAGRSVGDTNPESIKQLLQSAI